MDIPDASTPLWLQGRNDLINGSEGVTWRKGRPDYHLSDQLLDRQRSIHHAPGSLESTVERLVQAFELEVTHKLDPADWTSVDVEHFRVRTNGGPWYSAQDLAQRGTYNVFMGKSSHYNAEQESFESASKIFHTVFPEGFFWEVLAVYSPPPVVAFQWRHWGTFLGQYKDREATGKVVEIIGMSVARCTEDLRVSELENFYDNHVFLNQLVSGCPVVHGS